MDQYNCYLLLATTDSLPEEGTNTEMILIPDGFEDCPDDQVPIDSVSYMTTISIKEKNVDAAFEMIKDAWIEWAGSDIDLELISDDIHSMSKKFASTFRKLDDGSFSYRSSCILYRRDHEEAYEKARSLLMEASMKNGWLRSLKKRLT